MLDFATPSRVAAAEKLPCPTTAVKASISAKEGASAGRPGVELNAQRISLSEGHAHHGALTLFVGHIWGTNRAQRHTQVGLLGAIALGNIRLVRIVRARLIFGLARGLDGLGIVRFRGRKRLLLRLDTHTEASLVAVFAFSAARVARGRLASEPRGAVPGGVAKHRQQRLGSSPATDVELVATTVALLDARFIAPTVASRRLLPARFSAGSVHPVGISQPPVAGRIGRRAHTR